MSEGNETMASSPAEQQPVPRAARHPDQTPLRRFILDNRATLGSLAVFIIMLACFVIGNPGVFTQWQIYRAVLTTLPVVIFLVVPLVFIVTVGEIDLSFPATMCAAGWAFALACQAGLDPFIGAAAAIAVGLVIGYMVGVLVVYGQLSSLIATLGVSFMLRGLILIKTQGMSVAVVTVPQSLMYKIFSSDLFGIPVQSLWAVAFTIFCAVLYNRHRFGARVHITGDNPDAALQMGVNISRVRVLCYVFMGLGSAFAGVFSVLINFTWYPTSGDGYLLPVLASVFVGGTAPWGGVGTILGSAIGSVTVSFIQTGVVGVGLSGFYVQFFYGLIIILSLLGHRWNQVRYR
jgi:ribose/xylose/arabinose/galactoside ABC-type transport system permease subunit